MPNIRSSRKIVRFFTCFISGLFSMIWLVPAIALPVSASIPTNSGLQEAVAQAAPTAPTQTVQLVHDLQAFRLNPQAAPVIPADLEQSSDPSEGGRGVVGRDDRQLMTSRSYPWSAIGRISGVSAEGSSYICSGTLIAPTVVLTNAHCVINPETHQPSREIAFEPNLVNGWVRDGSHVAQAIRVLAGTDFQGTIAPPDVDDWALVEIDRPLGDLYGTIAWQPLPTRVLLNNPGQFILIGYSGDVNNGNTASVHAGCSITGEVNGVFQHDCDTTGGSSGGPILAAIDNEFRIVAVNSAEQTEARTGAGIVNFATRIQRIIDQL